MSKIKSITRGWWQYLFKDADENVVFRAEICKKNYGKNDRCATVGTYETFLPEKKIKTVKGLKCKKCGCPLVTKLREKNTKCPLGKF